jgi:predicted deacylase
VTRRGRYTIGDISAQPGSVARGLVPYARRIDGTSIGIPVVIVHGVEDGPTLTVDASCHGDEHEGTMAVVRLLDTVDPSRLRGTLVAVPLLNIPAVEAMQRGNPFDHWNSDLNRLFPGAADGNLTQRAAHTHVNVVAERTDYSISIHSGASYIYWSPQGVCTQEAGSMELVKMLGRDWDIVWQQGGEKAPLYGNCTAAMGARGVAAITIEVGGAAERMPGPFSQNVEVITGGILNVMRSLGMIDGAPTRAKNWTVVRQVAVRSGNAGLVVGEPARRLRTRVSAGTPLVRLLDAKGEEVEVVVAPVDGIVMGYRTYQYSPAGWPLVWMGEPIATWEDGAG